MELRRPVIHVFPGQGDFSVDPLVQFLGEPIVRKNVSHVFTRVDKVGSKYGLPEIGPLLLSPKPITDKKLSDLAPGAQQATLYGTQMALHYALRDIGFVPDRILGISFGEISALVASGACSLEDGARIAIRAARSMLHYPGGMSLLLASPERARGVIQRAGCQNTTVAGVNHGSEVIITAPDVRELDCLEQCAVDQGIRVVRLPLPFRCHHPSLETEAEDLRRSLADTRIQSIETPLYSAVHARAYSEQDDILRCVADSLTRPFHLPSVLACVSPSKPAVWLEVSSGKAVTRSARRTLRPPHLLYAPLKESSFRWIPRKTTKVT